MTTRRSHKKTEAPAPAKSERRSGCRPVVGGIGIAGLSALGYTAFILTRIPEAIPVNEAWTAGKAQTVRIYGPIHDRLITMSLRGEGLAAFSGSTGSKLVQPAPGTLAMLAAQSDTGFRPLSSTSPVDLRIPNARASVTMITVDVDRASNADADAAVELRPRIERDSTGLAIKAVGTALTATIEWTSPPPTPADTGPLLIGENGETLGLARAKISIPAGTQIYLGTSSESKPDFDLGSYGDRFSSGGLDVRRLEISGANQGPVTYLACASSTSGARQWPRPFGGIRSDACSGTLQLQDLELERGARLTLSGPAFVMRDGEVHYWAFFAALFENFIVKGVLTVVSAALIGWVVYWLGFRKPPND